MPDLANPRRAGVRVAWLVGAVALVAAMLAGPWPGLVGGLLAQPLFALATSAAPRRRGSQVVAVCAWWIGAVGVIATAASPALAWVAATGSLTAALVFSAVLGVGAVAGWRIWPALVDLARATPSVGDSLDTLRDADWSAWRGLGVALAVVIPAGLLAVIATGLASQVTPWLLVGGFALVSLLLHAAVGRVQPADLFELDVVLAEDPIEDAEPVHAALQQSSDALDIQLHDAARAGRVERALELIEQGADPHALPGPDDRDKRSLPVLAAVLPDLRLLRALIGQGVDVNAAHAGMTPLLAATRDSWHGRPDAVMTLLANGADPRLADRDGNTPLHFAARSADPGVAALLRDAAAELDAINGDGFTPLGVACASGNWRLAKFLLELGAHADADGAQPALLAAAGGDEDDPAGVALLLRLKARVDARNGDGRSALHEAAFAGHDQIVQALLAAGADVVSVDGRHRTALHEAARGGHLPIVERLLAHPVRGASLDPAALDIDARHALLHAALAERAAPELVARLLALGLDPEQRDVDGKRALDHAAEAGRWSLVAVLDPERVPASARDRDTETDSAAPLHDRPPSALLREALDAGDAGPGTPELDALAALLSPRERGGLLHDDEAAASPARVRWLLASGADADVRNAHGDTPMHAWLDRGANGAAGVAALLDAGVSPAGAGGLARFLAAALVSTHAARTLEPLALQLLDRGADPFARSRAGDPPLALSIRLGWLQLMQRLIDTGVDLDARDSHGMSALHLAAALGREPALRALIRRGATPDLLAADGQTPLGVALSSGRRDLADWLDWRGWPLPHRPLREDDVPAAAIVGDVDAVRRLLDLGFPADATDHQGCTALLRAAGGGHRAVIDLLLARGADPQRAAHSGATALSAAVSMRHVGIVDRLIQANASLEQRLPGELTVLMVACALGLPDLSARLLAAGADVHAVDAQGRTALHCAAMYGFSARERNRLVALFDTLLLAGAESDLNTSAAGATPLLLLLGARAEPGSAADEDVLCAGLVRLTDHDASLDTQDSRGFGPLHLAALHGLLRVVKWLLDAGANPDLRDTLNRPPREIAVMRGFVDIAAEFTPAPNPGGPVSMARLLRDHT